MHENRHFVEQPQGHLLGKKLWPSHREVHIKQCAESAHTIWASNQGSVPRCSSVGTAVGTTMKMEFSLEVWLEMWTHNEAVAGRAGFLIGHLSFKYKFNPYQICLA